LPGIREATKAATFRLYDSFLALPTATPMVIVLLMYQYTKNGGERQTGKLRHNFSKPGYRYITFSDYKNFLHKGAPGEKI
jgi:hypothetical protein